MYEGNPGEIDFGSSQQRFELLDSNMLTVYTKQYDNKLCGRSEILPSIYPKAINFR